MAHFLWTQKQDIGPEARFGSPMVFDAARGRAVLFGGQGTNLLADTWEWDGKEWTELADTGPAARWGHGVAFDSKRQRVVLFGGEDFGDYFGDTWVWDGSTWTRLTLTTKPPARAAASMASDPASGRIVLFGGEAADGTLLATDDGYALLLVDNSLRAIMDPPPELIEHLGERVWVAGPPHEAPVAFGVITYMYLDERSEEGQKRSNRR